MEVLMTWLIFYLCIDVSLAMASLAHLFPERCLTYSMLLASGVVDLKSG
jgi:hypothetical protein